MATGRLSREALFLDDGGQFGDHAYEMLTQGGAPTLRVAVEGSPERDNCETVAVVPPEELTIARGVAEAAARRCLWVVVPKDADNPLEMLIEASVSAARVLDAEHPGIMVVFSRPAGEHRRIAAVADVEKPLKTGVLAWAGVGAASRMGGSLDILVLGAETQPFPETWPHALERFDLGSGEPLVRAAFERAEAEGIEIRFRPIGASTQKEERILAAARAGGYDVVVDDLPEFNVGPKLGRRTRVHRALRELESDWSPYHLLAAFDGDVVAVLDSARMGILPEEMARAGAAAAITLGLAGVAASAIPAVSGTEAMAVSEVGTSEVGAAVDEAVAAQDEKAKSGKAKSEKVSYPVPAEPTKKDLANAEKKLDQVSAEQAKAQGSLDKKDDRLETVQRQKAQAIYDQYAVESEIKTLERRIDQGEQRVADSRSGLLGRDTAETAVAQAQVAEAEAALAAAEIKSERLTDREEELAEKEKRLAKEKKKLVKENRSLLEQQQARRVQVQAIASNVDVRVYPTTNYTLTASYGQGGGYWSSGYHTGTDFAAPSGTPIYSAEDGVVIEAGYAGAYGNYTVIRHEGGITTAYAHQSSISVSVGQRVSAGQTIGTVGSTGNSTGPHLHFEVRNASGNFMDPMAWLNS